MDALTGTRCKLCYGGSYTEHWSEDYVLSILYRDRREVDAEYDGTRWWAVGGDRELTELLNSASCPSVTAAWFQAAASVCAAVEDCKAYGVPLERLGERFHSSLPMAAAELMRVLMDDCTLPLEAAYRITADCCEELTVSGILPQELYPIQPRTAHVLSILRRTAETVPALIHDSRDKRFRSRFGACETGDSLRLAFLRRGGRIKEAELVLWGDDFEHSHSMECDGDLYYVNLALPEEPQALWYAFYIETESSAHWLCPDKSGYYGRIYPRMTEGFRLTVYRRGFETPEWFRGSVMYQIFPDRFAFSDDGTAERGIEYHRSLGQTPELHRNVNEPVRYWPRSFEKEYSPDDFYGGTLRGIENRLPYLKELGISCIYLNPIVEARSNHRYDTSDYTRPDPILGTTEDFKSLCRTAGELGIRLILDGVYSHTGCDSIYFDRSGSYGGHGACQDRDSEYYNWYEFRHFPDEYRCWWGFRDLPEVNELNGDWQNYIITGEDSIVKRWLRLGASGWRLDVADELPDSVLAKIRTAVKSVKPDAPIIGEVWEDAVIKESYGMRRCYALGDALDSVMNYPLRTAVLDFVQGRSDAFTLRDFLISQQMNYPKPLYLSLMNLLGTHDVPRIRTTLEAGKDIRKLPREQQLGINISDEAREHSVTLEKLCAAIQFAIPGVPSIYYGDEQGMEGVGDPFNRLPFRESNTELHDYYAELARLRISEPVMTKGETIFFAPDPDVLAVLRYVNKKKENCGNMENFKACLIVINRAKSYKIIRIDAVPAGCGVLSVTVEAESGKYYILNQKNDKITTLQ